MTDTLTLDALVEEVALEIGLITGARRDDVHEAARAALAAVAKAVRVEQVAIDSLEHSVVCCSAHAEACYRAAALLRTLAEAAHDA